MKHHFVAVVVLTLVVGALSANTTKTVVPKLQYTRTYLQVSRSLNPDSMQLLQVKTRSGDMATLIVKKRDGKQSFLPPTQVNEQERSNSSLGNSNVTQANNKSVQSIASETHLHNLIESRKRSGNNYQILPPPVTVLSNEQQVKSFMQPRADSNVNSRASDASAKNIYRGRPRFPDPDSRIPAPVYVRSIPTYVKGEREQEIKRSRGLMTFDSDGIPVIQGVRMPDDESDKQVWRNARVINGVLTPYAKAGEPVKKDNKQSETTLLERVPLEEVKNDKTNAESIILERIVPHRFPVDSQSDTSILNFIKTINQREMSRLENSQTRSSVGRSHHMLRSYEGAGNENVHTRPPTFYQGHPREAVEQPIISRKNDDANIESSNVQSRMLQYGSPIYPTSLLYTPQNKKPARASFEEGVRTPVLQYAHPELGVQPAKQFQPKTGKASTDAATFALFHQDRHSDRSPYVGMETEIDLESNEKQSGDPSSTQLPKANFNPNQRKDNIPNKNFVYDNQNYEFPRKSYYQKHDSYGLGNDDYIKRYPYDGYNNNVNSYNSYSGPYLVKVVERPFWERITDTIRDHVHTGMERVSDMTRPVVEPLIEATHKISKNLGFSQRSGGVGQIQEKVGTAVASYPVLLPALGLMAGGAALGLGAVAVGRYLDVGIMKQRSEDEEDDEMEHKRVLEGIDGEQWVQIQDTINVEDSDISNGRNMKSFASSTVDSKDNGRIVVEEDDSNQKKSEKLIETGKESSNSAPVDGELVILDETKNVKNADDKQIKHTTNTKVVQPNDNEQLITVSSTKKSQQDPEFTETRTNHRTKRETESEFLSDILQNIESIGKPTGLEHLQHHPNWANTPCSKRLFCDVMIQQSADSILLMEKKMATFLKLCVSL